MELLQNKLRPNNLKDVLGQKHLIGKGKVLTNLVNSISKIDVLSSDPSNPAVGYMWIKS